MNVLHRIKTAVRGAILRNGYARTRSLLLGLSDRQLEDAGISRTLLLQGIEAWPWREGETAPPVAGRPAGRVPARAPAMLRTAERELHAYTDKELADIGISRAGIANAVRRGRPGIEAQV